MIKRIADRGLGVEGQESEEGNFMVRDGIQGSGTPLDDEAVIRDIFV